MQTSAASGETLIGGVSTPIRASSRFPRNCPDDGKNGYEVRTVLTPAYERVVTPSEGSGWTPITWIRRTADGEWEHLPGPAAVVAWADHVEQETARAVERQLASLYGGELPEGLHVSFVNDSSSPVTEAMLRDAAVQRGQSWQGKLTVKPEDEEWIPPNA